MSPLQMCASRDQCTWPHTATNFLTVANIFLATGVRTIHDMDAILTINPALMRSLMPVDDGYRRLSRFL